MELEELSDAPSLSVEKGSWVFAKAKGLIVETMVAR